jgi:alkylated DNA repair dioxygenase AlkB
MADAGTAEIDLQHPKRIKIATEPPPLQDSAFDNEDSTESTEYKLAVLASLHSDLGQDVLLDHLLAHDGDIAKVSKAISGSSTSSEQKRKRGAALGYQASLHAYTKTNNATEGTLRTTTRALTKKGKTLHLYSPTEIENNTPCSIVHNFLTTDEADALLKELLEESDEFHRSNFQLFERTVQSPHTYRFYVDSLEEVIEQKTEYLWGGGASYEANVKQSTPWMLKLSTKVRIKVNEEIQRRTRDFHASGQKLKFQSPDEWAPNASFVNCYASGKEHVGWHTDQLTYLGPRCIIGSLSLGVAREFRIRKIVPPPSGGDGGSSSSSSTATQADEQGQIAIHLPHNSLLIMHAAMQESYKHSVAAAPVITPHPIAGTKRLNVTYRHYRKDLHPKLTPRCRCGRPTILRCVQKRAVSLGRYVWMCHADYEPGGRSCGFFEWAELDVDGRPRWAEGYKGNANGPLVGREGSGDGGEVKDE